MESDAVPQAEPEPEEPLEPGPTPVPRELIAEIEAFKDQVRRGPGKAPASAKPAQTAKAQDPTALRLTAAQQAELPPFMMTVHVYVTDKARRFVLINGLKYGEGNKTREDLTVEQILPNGAVLSFQGNSFYVHR
jgi:general secretion pathway protein B